MQNILNFDAYSINETFYNRLYNEFVKINESNEETKINKSDIKKELNELVDKFGSQYKSDLFFVGSFSAAFAYMTPLLDAIAKNQDLGVVASNPTVKLMIIVVSLTIMLMNKKELKKNEDEAAKKFVKSLLEELELNGIGQNIVKKFQKTIELTYKLFVKVGKAIGFVIDKSMTIFEYVTLAVPCTNVLLSLISEYQMNLDNVILNLNYLLIGAGTFIVQHFGKKLISKIKTSVKNKLKLSKEFKGSEDDQIES